MSKHLTRRDFLRSASFTAAAGVLAACAPQTAPTAAPAAVQPTTAPAAPKEVVKINYWHGWSVDTEKKAMEDAVKLFNDSHPNILVEPTSGKTNDMVLTAVSGGNPPDAWSLWSTQTLAEWASKGVIMDLNDQVAMAKIDTTQFIKGALDVSTYKGKFFGLPIEVDPLVVYYNKGMFKEAGLDPETPPKNMEELYMDAIKLTKLDANGNVSQLGWSNWAPFMEAYLYGGQWWDPNTGQPTANQAGNVASWKMIAEYFKKYGAEKIGTFNSQQADNPLGSLLVAGKVAMALDGDWVVNFMTRFAPTIEFGMFPLPSAMGHDDRAMSTYLDGSVYVIPSGTKHTNESWEYVSWMATSKEASGLLQKVWSNTSPIKTVVADPAYAPHSRWQIFIDMIQKGQHFVWPPIAISALYSTELGTALDGVKFGKKDPQAALDELQAKMVDELKKAG